MTDTANKPCRFYCIKDISNNIKHIGEKYKRTTTQRIDAMLFILYFYHMKTIITEYCAELKDFTLKDVIQIRQIYNLFREAICSERQYKNFV